MSVTRSDFPEAAYNALRKAAMKQGRRIADVAPT